MMNVTDIRAATELAHAHGALLIVDNTFLSPYLQNPLALGADIVIHSGTKDLSGHNDTLAGFAVVKDAQLAAQLREISKTVGAVLSPFDSWLVLRGIQTLAVRMDRAQANAVTLANWLKTQPAVQRVIYPGLPEHPGHTLMERQARGFGAMLTFEVQSKEYVPALLRSVKLIRFAESLGGTETLLTYPLTQTHADVPPEALRKQFRRIYNAIGYSQLNAAGIVAAEAAYTHGEVWYNAVNDYLCGNIAYMAKFLRTRLPQLTMHAPEGTYLVWVDFRRLGLSPDALEDFILHKAKIWLDSGAIFGTVGQGFQWFNIACPRATLTQALTQLETAVNELTQS